MGANASGLSQLRQRSQRREGSISCHIPIGHRRHQRQPIVMVLSRCVSDTTWKLAIAIIESYGGNIRLHATTNDYDHVKKIDDKLLLKYLNTKLFVHKVDLSNEASVDEFWGEIFKLEVSIDVIVLHMDQMYVKSIDESSTCMMSSSFESNLFAPMLLIKTLLPTLKSQKKGKIVCLTTIGGAVGIPLHSIYCATKFAMEGFLESLASECMNHSIKVSIIQTSLDKEQSPSRMIYDLPDETLILSSKQVEDRMNMQEDTVEWLEKEKLLRELNVKKISGTIKSVVESKEPKFRYIVCKRCNVVLSEKLKDLHGCSTIKEVSKFFLNADIA